MDNQSQPRRAGLVLAVLSTAAFMASLDLFIVNVAFDDIRHDFSGSSLSDLSWVLNAYAITYAALLVPLGRLADRYGRKAGFLLGVAVFTAASAACALSPGLWWLVGLRALQAAGAAALTPTSLGLLLAATPPARRVRAVRIWAASGGLAAAAGPVVGGLLVNASWRWVFLVNIPVGILALVVAARIVPGSRDLTSTRLPDAAGAVLLTAAIGGIALGFVKSPDWGWTSAGTATAFAVAVVGLVVFWLRSHRHHTPIVDPALLKVRAFAWSNVTAVAFSAAFAGGLLAAVLWLQEVWGYSPLHTGLAIAPGPVMVPLFAFVTQRFGARIAPGRVAALGCGLFGAAYLIVVLSIGAQPSYVLHFLPAWLLGGVGVGLALPTIMSAATADLPPDRTATGSAIINMSRQIGAVLGISVLIAVLGSPHGYSATHTVFVHAWLVIAAVGLLGAVSALGMTPQRALQAVPTVAPQRGREDQKDSRTAAPAAGAS
ncbi:MAG: putative transporter, major facilitator superfamily [Frankiales bacterium]|nr:putative transporter, major facilitator superfamily [Frankiales bacterium]